MFAATGAPGWALLSVQARPWWARVPVAHRIVAACRAPLSSSAAAAAAAASGATVWRAGDAAAFESAYNTIQLSRGGATAVMRDACARLARGLAVARTSEVGAAAFSATDPTTADALRWMFLAPWQLGVAKNAYAASHPSSPSLTLHSLPYTGPSHVAGRPPIDGELVVAVHSDLELFGQLTAAIRKGHLLQPAPCHLGGLATLLASAAHSPSGTYEIDAAVTPQMRHLSLNPIVGEPYCVLDKKFGLPVAIEVLADFRLGRLCQQLATWALKSVAEGEAVPGAEKRFSWAALAKANSAQLQASTLYVLTSAAGMPLGEVPNGSDSGSWLSDDPAATMLMFTSPSRAFKAADASPAEARARWGECRTIAIPNAGDVLRSAGASGYIGAV